MWFGAIRDFLYSEPVFVAQREWRLHLGATVRGWVDPAVGTALLRLAPELARYTHGELQLPLNSDYASRSRRLQALTQELHAAGLVAGWRNELMVLHDAGGQPWAELERAAFRTLGLGTVGVHLNALVASPAGAEMWIARRSASKAVDPGMLDNLVGGGVIAGESIATTLQREAWEEAGLAIRFPGRPQGRLHILRRSDHGVQDETLYVHERWLPSHFRPENHDGELAGTRRLALAEVLARLQQGRFTRDAALVILDGLCRQFYFGRETPAIRQLLADYGLYPEPA